METFNIYYKLNGKQFGPVSLEELNLMLETDHINSNDLISFVGSNIWKSISEWNLDKVEIPDTSSKRCNNCHKRVKKDFNFCHVCGLDFISRSTKQNCPLCGIRVNNVNKICKCNAQLHKKCPLCNWVTLTTSRFCYNCEYNFGVDDIIACSGSKESGQI